MTHLIRPALVAGLLVAVAAPIASAQRPVVRKARPAGQGAPRASRRLSLLAGGSGSVALTANRVSCLGITSIGTHCDSGEGEGGFWPAGTSDNYVWSGGLQVAATVPVDAGFKWAGDTVGVFFMNPAYWSEGVPVTGVFNSLNADDLARWPSAAYANDTSLFSPQLIGRAAVSDQDTWVRYWDGDPSATSLRAHMMGLVVDQRTMEWNRGAHRDIVYLTFRLINVTSRQASSYAGLAAYGYSAADQQALAALGATFQDSAEARDPTLQVPAGGFTFQRLFAAYYQDPDVGYQASLNFSTAVLPFSLVAGLKDNYSEPLFQYPIGAFAPPFAAAPGFEAIQFLRSIPDSAGREPGIRVWSNPCQGGGVNPGCAVVDAQSVGQLYRYLSGYFSPVLDGACNSDPIALQTCIAIQGMTDTRFFESTGPQDLPPGQSLLIAVAMLYAAPVDSQPATTNGMYAMPAFTFSTYQGAAQLQGAGAPTFLPGWPATAETLAVVGTGGGSRVCTTTCDKAGTIREPVERAMGWGQFGDANSDGRIEMGEVQTVPGSLLNKAQAAQALFDRKFLLPSPPAAPAFFLVPGDGKVTIVWQKSATENVTAGGGDPYFAVASDPTSPLYDPDYRQYDVTGYRIWRGTSASDLALIAEFEVADGTFADYTGQVVDPAYGSQCAPELGVTATCPTFPVSHSLTYALTFVQAPLGGRVLLGNGNVGVVQADTVVFRRGSEADGPSVPYVYGDSGVRNGFSYVYAVTAFDVNSDRSGPPSLESPQALKTVTPRVPSSNAHDAVVVSAGIFGDDTLPLDSISTLRVDSTTGAFSGLVPPANAATFVLGPSVVDALPPGDIVARIDSVGAGITTDIGTPPPSVYLSLFAGPDTVRAAIPMPAATFSTGPDATNAVPYSATVPAVRYDTARARALGLPVSFVGASPVSVTYGGAAVPLSTSDAGQSLIEGLYSVPGGAAAEASRYLLHAVWYAEGGSEPPQPTVNPFGSQAHTNGLLPNVDIIYEAAPYRLPVAGGAPSDAMSVESRFVIYGMPAAYYPADFVVTWNADSSITVRDSTHRVFLPFKTDLVPGWGFVNERQFVASGVTATDLTAGGQDAEGTPSLGVVGYHHAYALRPACTYLTVTCTVLQPKAEFEPIDYQNQGLSGGNGIALYIDGMFFVMKMSALPAAGTRWHLKAVSGTLSATCPTVPVTPATVPAACSGYAYAPAGSRPAYVPGLRYKIRVTQGFTVAAASGDLSRIHTVPDPFYNHSDYETAGGPRRLVFVNLPDRAIIRIYSTSGILVRILTHNDPSGGGEEPWDLLSRNGKLVASGVYFYHVEAPDGRTRVGRMTIVNTTVE